jgi:hypothetical protein
MVQPRPAGMTGERSHRKIHSSPQAIRGGSGWGRGFYGPCSDNAASVAWIPPRCGPPPRRPCARSAPPADRAPPDRAGSRGRGMQASASGMAAPWGPADQDQPCGAQRFVAEDLRIVGPKRALLDATLGRPIAAAAIVTAPVRIGVSAVGRRQVRHLPAGQPRDARARGFFSRVLNGFLFLRGEDWSARAQRMIVLGR